MTRQMKVLDQVDGARSLTLRLSGMGGTRGGACGAAESG